MVIYSLTSAPQRIRGLISRYCIEIRSGLFIGRLDKRMRLKLWAAIEEAAKPNTTAVMAWSRPSDQGYEFKSIGPNARRPIRIDGIWVVSENKGELAAEENDES